MATQTHPKATELDLSAVLQALSDPVRRSIVARLAREGEVPCGGFDLERHEVDRGRTTSASCARPA